MNEKATQNNESNEEYEERRIRTNAKARSRLREMGENNGR